MSGADKYNHTLIEKKWQDRWEKEKLYVSNISLELNGEDKQKFYNLWMFPYPSAEGLHAGHAFASTGSDIYGRFMRMHGYEVFQPIGYDSFGIHAENYAIKVKEDPHEVVKRTTKHYEEQMRSLGHSYDWTRTVTTSDIDYYHWTEWLFAELFKAGLAYRKKAEVNFCPKDKTVLADEQVMTPKQAGKDPVDANGKPVPVADDLRVCERCGTVVEKKELVQWFFRITSYADRLLSGLSKIDWTEKVKIAQHEWIGKREGVTIDHKVEGSDLILTAFSAYPAWLFADTFLVIAPEHPIVFDLVRDTKYESSVLNFVKNFKTKSHGKGSELNEKEGIFTGRYVLDPFSGKKMPVWLANFALVGFGTGIIRCSAHDPRDYQFAQKYQIELKEVVARTNPKEGPVNAHGNAGILKDSGPFSGRPISDELIGEMIDWIEEKKIGKKNINYHLRDWLISRQRYWGCPIPMIYCETCAKARRSYITEAKNKIIHKDQSDWDHYGWWVDENLPLELPRIKDWEPEGSGKGPLANHPDYFKVKCPNCGANAVRETDVADTFLDSSWYFLRYPSTRSLGSGEAPFDKKITKKWLPVDLYFGGAEHSVLHLMYARFVTMVLSDLGYLNFDEPFPKFYAHGLMIKDGAKMSKSRGNVVNPDDYIEKYGADALRIYLAFMGPMDSYPDFRDSGMEGAARFIGRLYRLFSQPLKNNIDSTVTIKMHQTVKGVTDDIQNFKYNTAIAKIMEFVNVISDHGADIQTLKNLALILAPFTPHLSEEVWNSILSMPFSIHKAPWPSYESKYIEADNKLLVVQVNGKVRGQITVASSKSDNEKEVVDLAKNDKKVTPWISGAKIKKTIFVPGKLINFVI